MRKSEQVLFVGLCTVFLTSFVQYCRFFIFSRAYQGKPLSPLIPLVNPFPSKFIVRNRFSFLEKYHISLEAEMAAPCQQGLS